MFRCYLIILVSLLLGNASAQEIRVGIFHSIHVKNVSIQKTAGSYQVFGDTSALGSLDKLTVAIHQNGVQVISGSYTGVYDTLRIVKLEAESVVKLVGIQPKTKEHEYEDNFEITKGAKGLRIVNEVALNNYLSGVIESEGGGGRHIEYYKVQALMSRTYALKNKQRHKKDGFNVCDGVHCQAYHNKLRYTPSIRDAVEATEGVVLVDGNNRLVTSYFSANCGGQVCDASYVWNTSVPYVAPFIDTFCIHTRQATWTTSVDRYTWRNYLRDQFGVTEAKYGTLIYEFNATDRTAFYLHPSLGIPMRDLRHKFRLKSAYFSTRLENDNVIIEGRGFGHGVGLCQEGAMEMAKQGYDYTQIARFYFHNVSVLDARRSMFFEQVSTESDLGF